MGVRSLIWQRIFLSKYHFSLLRKETTTRLRDYYDMYVMYGLYKEKINYKVLKNKVSKSASERGISEDLKNYKNIISILRVSPELNRHWNSYQKNYPYAKNISFNETCDALESLLNKIS